MPSLRRALLLLAASTFACSPDSSLTGIADSPEVPLGKADSFFPAKLEPLSTAQLRGALAYATTTQAAVSSAAPGKLELTGYTFEAKEDDVILASVLAAAPSGAKAAVAIADQSYKVLAASSPSEPGFLRAPPLPASGTYYLVFAESTGAAASFEVQVNALEPIVPPSPRITWEPPAPGVTALTAVRAIGADEVWAAGRGGVLFHRKGAALKRFDLGLHGHDARAIWVDPAQRVFALFADKLVLLEAGSFYRLTTMPGQTTYQVSGQPSGLLWALSRKSCKALWCSQGDIYFSSWDGRRWQHRSSGLFSKNWFFAHALLASSSSKDVWVFGRENDQYENVVAERFNGLDWVQAGALPGSTDVSIAGGATLPSGQMLLVGSSGKRNYAASWDGTGWKAIDLPCDSFGTCVNTELAGVWGESLESFWITGKRQAYIEVKKQNVFRRTTAGWKELTAPYDLAVDGTGGVPWFAGQAGYLARDSGGPVLEQVTQPVLSCTGLGLRPSGAPVAACGKELLVRSGSSWSRNSIVSLSKDERLVGVFAESETASWLITTSGRVLRKDGLAEKQLAVFPGSELRSISGSSAAEIWIGSASSVARWDGKVFAPVPGLSVNGLAQLLVMSPKLVLVLESQRLQVFDGTSWQAHPFTETRRGLCATAADDIWVSGDESLQHWDGSTWTTHRPQPQNNSYDYFTSIACTGKNLALTLEGNSLDAYQFDGTAWKIVEKAPARGEVLQRLPGGDLLLATGAGLLRFH